MFSSAFQLKLLDLYSEDICSRISQCLNLGITPPFLSDFISPIICNKLLAIEDENERIEKVWEGLTKSPMNSQLYSRILEFIKDGNPFNEF